MHLSPSQVATLVESLIPIAGGLLCALYGFRVIGKRPGADPRFDAWYDRYGRMMRVVGPLVLLFGVWRIIPAFLPPADPPPARLRNSSLGQVQVGTVWIYQAPGGDLTTQVVAHERVSGVLCARRETTRNGTVLMTDYVCPQEGALWKYGSGGGIYVPPIPIVYESPGGPRRWEYRSAKGTFKIDFEQSDGGPLQTPLGRYERTILVALRGTDASGEQLTQSWYVEGVGLVRELTKQSGNEVLLELRSFGPVSER